MKEGDRQKPKDESEWITVKDHHAPIVSREQKERILATLKSNSRINKTKSDYKRGKHIHIFSGLVYCGGCGNLMYSAPSPARADGSRYSRYSCLNARKTTARCTGKSTSDPIVGEFVINYILNMLNAQRGFDDIKSPEALQERLLSGISFQYIESIEEDGLLDLYNVLTSGKVQGAIYGKGVDIKPSKENTSEIAALRAEKQRVERALDRLRNLYLYSEDAMAEKEYVLERTKLIEKLDELNDEIGIMQTDEWQEALSDEAFIARASEFIIAQKLSGRAYINFRRLQSTVDAGVLRSFITSIIDSIIVLDGKVQRITFKNGLSHTFIFKS